MCSDVPDPVAVRLLAGLRVPVRATSKVKALLVFEEGAVKPKAHVAVENDTQELTAEGMCAYVCMYGHWLRLKRVCMCVCLRVFARARVCACECVRVCARARVRGIFFSLCMPGFLLALDIANHVCCWRAGLAVFNTLRFTEGSEQRRMRLQFEMQGN